MSTRSARSNRNTSLTHHRVTISGFTLIELMIVIAIIAIILTLAVPAYSNYLIRSKIGEGLSVANAAVTAVSATCIEDLSIAALTNNKAGYNFMPGAGNNAYVESIVVGGPCTDPVITVTTKNTGTSPDPVLVLTGTLRPGRGHVAWVCFSTAPNTLLPSSCRT